MALGPRSRQRRRRDTPSWGAVQRRVLHTSRVGHLGTLDSERWEPALAAGQLGPRNARRREPRSGVTLGGRDKDQPSWVVLARSAFCPCKVLWQADSPRGVQSKGPTSWLWGGVGAHLVPPGPPHGMREVFKENWGAALEKGGVRPGRQEQQTLHARLAGPTRPSRPSSEVKFSLRISWTLTKKLRATLNCMHLRACLSTFPQLDCERAGARSTPPSPRETPAAHITGRTAGTQENTQPPPPMGCHRWTIIWVTTPKLL